MWTIRKAMALLGIAVILLTALLPGAVLFVAPLVLLGALIVATGQSATSPIQRRSTFAPIRRALVASRHLPRAFLPPARS